METALHEAVRSRQEDIVKLLIAKDADINIAGLEHGGTALHMVLYHSGDAGMVALLLEGGADPNAKDSAGKTPADIASENPQRRACSAQVKSLPPSE